MLHRRLPQKRSSALCRGDCAAGRNACQAAVLAGAQPAMRTLEGAGPAGLPLQWQLTLTPPLLPVRLKPLGHKRPGQMAPRPAPRQRCRTSGRQRRTGAGKGPGSSVRRGTVDGFAPRTRCNLVAGPPPRSAGRHDRELADPAPSPWAETPRS
jgi:hypothetical protein